MKDFDHVGEASRRFLAAMQPHSLPVADARKVMLCGLAPHVERFNNSGITLGARPADLDAALREVDAQRDRADKAEGEVVRLNEAVLRLTAERDQAIEARKWWADHARWWSSQVLSPEPTEADAPIPAPSPEPAEAFPLNALCHAPKPVR